MPDQTSDAAPPAGPSAGVLRSAVLRLGETLDRETAALKANEPVDLDEFADLKNRGLLELTRLGRGLDPGALDASAAALLRDLGRKLEHNRAILALHLEAVREIAEILSVAERDAESDGTYSGNIAERRR